MTMKTQQHFGLLGYLLVAPLMLSLAGCAGGGGATSTAAPPEGTQAPVVTGTATAAASATGVPDPNATAIAVVTAFVAASNAEDIDAYMACIDPSSPLYSSTRTQMTTTFEQYDFRVEATDIKVLDLSATVAHVQAVLTTTKISGPAYKDNRLTVIFELHEVSGAWKIYGENVTNTEYL
jgi:ketosteroid isomerase-like protein